MEIHCYLSIKLRNFNSHNFTQFHPGGELAKKFTLKIKDIMRTDKKNSIINFNSIIGEMFNEITKKMLEQ